MSAFHDAAAMTLGALLALSVALDSLALYVGACVALVAFSLSFTSE